MSRTWLITGASSGFGRLLSERVAASGDDVIAVARRADRLEELTGRYPEHISPVTLDLTSSHAGQMIYAVIRDAGGLDVLVNNAGYGLIGSVEQCDDAAVRAQFDLNFFAALTVTRAALPALRLSQGRIVQVSSGLSELAAPGTGLYSASKSALTLASQALALELAPGVHVTTIHPGHFGTEFVDSAHVVAPNEVYASTVGATLAAKTTLPPEAVGDPHVVVDAVLAVVNADQPPRRLAIGADAVEWIRDGLQTSVTEMAAWGPDGGMSF
jgi:NAD(P)-dependent dehydrogenase (short-subunit alcohol dehydrogenase family)